MSFSNATLVLSIGETVEEVTDSGFLTTSPTLQVLHAYIHLFVTYAHVLVAVRIFIESHINSYRRKLLILSVAFNLAKLCMYDECM